MPRARTHISHAARIVARSLVDRLRYARRAFAVGWLVLLATVTLIGMAPGTAEAYTWMIGHGYTGCATCHADPSGGGLLNTFGRSEATDTLRSHYGGDPPSIEPNLGLAENPGWLLTGASLRVMDLLMKVSSPPGAGGAPAGGWTNTLILMQADLRAGLRAGHWRAAASLGVITNGNSPAAVVGKLVAREYWLGYAFRDDTLLLRAGRLTLPFGIRSIEHTLFVRSATRTDLNDTQQHGVAFAWRGGGFRGELQAILGNYQSSPDAFRQRGYSGFAEWSPASQLAVGVSSLVTHAAEDLYLGVANTRQAHGLLVRAAPIERLVLLGEADYVTQAPSGLARWNGLATMLQADVEVWQGLHVIGTGETYSSGQPGTVTSWGAWGGLDWFCLSRVDLRLDYMHRGDSVGAVRVPVDAFMIQFHLFL